MAPTIKNIKMWLLLLALSCGAVGCIRDDTSDCLRGVYIYFKPENKKHNYPELVRVVNLYFYNEAGNLVAEFTYDKDELYSKDKAAFVENLPEGNYTLVSIINHMETYRTVHKEQLTSIQSYLRDKQIDYPLVDFFSGIHEFTMEKEPRLQKVTTGIFKHNNDIRVEIISDGYEPPPGTTFNAYIEGNNGAYHYHSATSPGGNVIKYIPHHAETDDNHMPITCDFTIMRLWRNADLILYLQEQIPFQGVTRTIQLNIADELAKVVNKEGEHLYDTDAKLSFTDTYNITITLSPGFIILELSINDWAVIKGGMDV